MTESARPIQANGGEIHEDDILGGKSDYRNEDRHLTDREVTTHSPIRRGGSNRYFGLLQQLKSHGVPRATDPYPPCPSRDGRWYEGGSWEDQGQWARPEGLSKAGDKSLLSLPSWESDQLGDGRGVGHMDNERVRGRAAFDSEDPGHGMRVEGIGTQAIHCLGGEGHQGTFLEKLGSLPHIMDHLSGLERGGHAL